MDLKQAINVRPGEVVAFIGAGSKTSVAWRLLRLLVAHGEKVVLTSTTYFREPKGPPVLITPDPEPGDIVRSLISSTVLVLASRREKARSEISTGGDLLGSSNLIGLSAQVVNDLARRLPGVTWLIEADDVKTQKLAVPTKNGLIVPPTTDRLVMVAAIEALGRRLEPSTVHQPELAARLLGAQVGATISTEIFTNLLLYTAKGIRRILPGTKTVVILTQNSDSQSTDAEAIAQILLQDAPIERVTLVSLTKADPVLGVWL